MRIKTLITSFATVVAIIFVPAFQDIAGADSAPLVKEMEIEGLIRISGDVVNQEIYQQLDTPLSPDTVARDIKAIYELGYFEDVRAEVDPFEGGVRLVYVVKEKPSVRRIEHFGNKKVKDEDIETEITISPGSMANTMLITDNANRIKALCEEKGYPLAVVVPIIREIDDNHVLLTYQINEGSKINVRDIDITGNNEVSERKIKRAMETSERGIFSWLTGKGRYKKDVLASDVKKIMDVYHNEGFIQAMVSEPEVSIDKEMKRAQISIEVSEGDQFIISSLNFKGNEVFSSEELLEEVKSTPGDIISKKIIDEDVAKLMEIHATKGYALINIYPDISVGARDKTVDLTFKVDEGDIFSIGRINISGNQKTKDKVIRRELRINEGDTFDISLLRRSYERINNLGFFESVELKPEPHIQTNTMDMNIDVEERSTGSLNVGMGYSTVDDFVGMVDIVQANVAGTGRYVKTKFELGNKSTLYELSYRDPWLFDRPVSFSTSLYNSMREYDSYKKRSTGFTLGLGKRWEYWSTSATYRFERATIFDVKEFASQNTQDEEGSTTTSSITPAISRDTRDNRLYPHSGSLNTFSFTYAGLGGDNKFLQLNFSSTLFLPVTERTHFSLKGRYGIGMGLFEQELPLYKRYVVGGPTTVRGLREVGPTDDNDFYIGGKEKMIFNVEYIFPLVDELRLQGEIFYDVGTAYDDISELSMKDSAGIGVRWGSPLGPLKFDLVLYPEDPDYKWEFTLGTFF
jgi:outer membrane protein insertion porin family